MVGIGLALALAAALLSSCGGNTSETPTTPEPGEGTLIVFIGDTPACDVLSLRLTVTDMGLTPQGGGSAITVFSSSSTTPFTIGVNFASLRDFATILHTASMPEGIYEAATIVFSLRKLALFDPTESPPVITSTPELTTLTPTFAIRPALTVVKDKVHVLRVDFDLFRSLQLDSLGQVIGTVNPVMKGSPVSPVPSQGFGELDDLIGFVRSVSPAPTAGTNFIGGFNLQLLAGTGPVVTVNLTNETQLFGVPGLNQLETGRFAEVHAFVDESGNLVARAVEVEERAVVEENKLAFLGYVISVDKDSSGNATQFDFYVREEEPDLSAGVPLDSIVQVNVSSSTAFQFSSRPTNFANLPFDATAIAPGQELIVHGTFSKPENEPTNVDASAIYLKLQTVQGSFSSLVQVGKDGKTGAFLLNPCASICQGAPILVLTNNETAFINVFGLGQLTPQPALLVRGLPFFEDQGGMFNGVPVPPGTLVMTARQVRQLE